MKRALLVLILVLACACRRPSTYSADGDVVLVDVAHQQIVLNHEDIPGLMPAMTMGFPVADPAALGGITPGTRVHFTLQKDGTRLVVTALTRTPGVLGSRPGIHDHTPHHGGVVAMTGMLHLEALATPEGRVAVWLTDVWRRPLPVEDASGTATLFPPEGVRSVPLVAHDGALEGQVGPLVQSDVRADVRLARAGETIEAHFLLPLHPGTAGAVMVPSEGCQPPATDVEARGLHPRCTVHFPSAISALAATPDAGTALVAVAGAGVTAWRMPAGELVTGFAAPPPMPVPIDEPPHADVVNAVAVSPDSRQIVATSEARLLRYDVTSGTLLRVLDAPHGVLRAVAWSPDGAQLLITAFYDHDGHLEQAEDGALVRTIPLGGEGAGVAFSPDGRWAAVGTEDGPITLVDRVHGGPDRVLSEPRRPSESLAFVGGVLAAGGHEGVLWLWDATSGALTRRLDVGAPIVRLATVSGRPVLALASRDQPLRLYDVARGALLDTLTWHRAAVTALAWSGQVLLSGDADGALALWDLNERLAAP